METEVFETVRNRILDSEAEYLQAKADSRGVRAVVKAIEKMRQVRGIIVAEGSNTESIDQLIEKSERKFSNALDSLEPATSPSQPILDFKEWAHELQCVVKLHDPLMLSLDLTDDESIDMSDCDAVANEAPKSWAALSSKKLAKMTPLGKHHDDTFAYLEGSSQNKVQQFRSIAFCAWTFAVLMLVLALSFLTKEFIQSQRNPGIRIEQIAFTELALPVTSFCTDLQGVPSFHDYPTAEYPGYPLFLVSALKNLHDEAVSTIQYPELGNTQLVEESYLGTDLAKCKSDLSRMSIRRSRETLFRYNLEKNVSIIGVDKLDKHPCQKCFSIGKGRKQIVSATKVRSPVSMPVSVTVSSSSAYAFCVLRHGSRSAIIQTFFETELAHYAAELSSRGIISLPSGLTQRDKTSAFMATGNNDVSALREMMCSVYFFSGFFYPSEDAGKISFDWMPTEKKWKSTGTAKYSTLTHNISSPNTAGPGSETLSKDVYFSKSIEVHYEDQSVASKQNGLVAPFSAASFLSGPSETLAYIKRTQQSDNSILYNAETSTHATSSNGLFSARFNEWTVGFDYREFATTTVSEQPTMSWPEFVTDIFEFVGLFTGVCIFSMIVAPSQALV